MIDAQDPMLQFNTTETGKTVADYSVSGSGSSAACLTGKSWLPTMPGV